MRANVCIVTCPKCGKMYNPDDPSQWPHICSQDITSNMRIEMLERKAEELERKLSEKKGSTSHYFIPRNTDGSLS